MDGYKRMSGDQRGHLHVSIYAGAVRVGSGPSKSETRTTKDSDGNEQKTTYYWYNFPVSHRSTKTEGTEIFEYDLLDTTNSAFSIGERAFEKMHFSPCAKVKGEFKMCILETLYASDKLNLYKYHPSTSKIEAEKPEFAFKKAADAAPVSLLDTQFLLLKKGLASYFSDCATYQKWLLKEDLNLLKRI